MPTEIKVSQVIEIDPNCKYAVILDHAASFQDMEYIKDRLQQFWKSDDKFVILWGAQLVKIDAHSD